VTYYEMQAPIRRKLPAVLAGVALLFAGALSIGGVNIFGWQFSFAFVPLVVLAIWPRDANSLLSLALVFAAGLFTDWATGTPWGQWALVFSVTWGVLRPELRSSPYAPVSFFFVWIATCGLAVVLLTLSGWFVFRVFPDFGAFGRQMIFATLLLPVILLLRRGISKRFAERDEWGG